jgi:hypothetical protein
VTNETTVRAERLRVEAVARCETCGRETDEHERDIRFGLPDPVLRSDEKHLAAGTWMSDDNPNAAVMMQVPELGPFVRSLLPVRLSGGFTVTYGVWISISPADLQQAYDVWWKPQYSEMQLTGRLANEVPPWNVFGAPVDLAVRDPEEIPYCVSSSNSELAQVIADEWNHDLVLSTLP